MLIILWDGFKKKGVISYYDYSGLYKLTKKKKYLLKVKSLGKILDNGLKIKTQRFEVIWYGVGVQVTWKNNHIAPAYFTEKEFYTLDRYPFIVEANRLYTSKEVLIKSL